MFTFACSRPTRDRSLLLTPASLIEIRGTPTILFHAAHAPATPRAALRLTLKDSVMLSAAHDAAQHARGQRAPARRSSAARYVVYDSTPEYSAIFAANAQRVRD